MADYYVDHGSAYATDLGATPTWGVPQEGDGSSKDAATASAIASIKFNAVPTTGAYTLAGASVSVTGVLSAANVGAAATALAANINATTNAVSSTAAVGTPQLRNLVFARVDPGNSDTVQIMTRVGSATLNHASNSNVAQVHTFNGTAPTVVQFIDGTGGCWGWLCNAAAIGVSSSIAAVTYGVMARSLPYVSASEGAPTVAATPTISDTIWARTASGKTIAPALNVFPDISLPNYSHNLFFDSNQKWTGDSGTGQVTLALQSSSADIILRLVPSTSGLSKTVRCARKGGLKFTFAFTTALGNPQLQPTSSSGGRAVGLYSGVIFEQLSGTGTNIRFTCNGYSGVRLKDCDVIDNVVRSSWTGTLQGGNIDGAFIWEGGNLVNNHTSGADPGPVVNALLGAAGTSVRFIGVSITGWSFGRYRVASTGVTMSPGCDLSFEGCTGITLGTSYINLSAAEQGNPNVRTAIITSADAGLGYRYEYRAGVVDWNPDASPAYPTRNALLMDGTTPWAIKLDWFASTVAAMNNLVTPRMSVMNRLADGTRTIAVDFLTPATVTAFDLSIRVHYIGTDGKARVESSYGLPSALTTPSNTWTGTGSYPSHAPRRLSVTTTSAIKQGTEVAVYFEATGNPPGNTGIQLYVDPEFSIT